MRLLAVLLAACLFVSCNPKPVPERQLYKRDDAGSNGERGKLSSDFNVVDDMLSSLDQCFHILEQAVNDCGTGGNKPAPKSQELGDERESDHRRKGSETEPPTTPPTTPSRAYTGSAVVIVHSQEEGLEKSADQQGIGNRDREHGRTSDPPPPTPEVIVVIDRNGNAKSSDESAASQGLRKDDSSAPDQDDRKEEEEEEKPHPTASVIVVNIDRGEGGSESAGASSQSMGKGKGRGKDKGKDKGRGDDEGRGDDRGRGDEDDERPTPDVIVIHINRKEETGQEAAVEQSRRKPDEPVTDPTTVPTSERTPPKVIIIHTDGKGKDSDEEAEAEGLRRPETTDPPTSPPTEPPTHRSIPSTDVIIIHRDQPSTAEIESDVDYALRYWSNRRVTDSPTEATQAPPTTHPRGPVRIIIIPDARDESVDEIVSQVTAYSVGDRLRFRNKNDEEEMSTEAPPTVSPLIIVIDRRPAPSTPEAQTEPPPTESPVERGDSPLIVVINRRPTPSTSTTTETQTEPPPDDGLALKAIQLAGKKLKADTLLKTVSIQAKEDANKAGLSKDDEKFEMELERGGMFMYPAAHESSREKENKTESDSSRGDSSSRRNKTTDATDLPTEESSATIETDASDSPTRDDSTTSTTEEPSDNRHSESDATTDTEEPSESTTATTDQPTDSEATDVTTSTSDSDPATHSPDTTTDGEPEEAEAEGEWPMESVFYEQSARSSSKKTDVMDKALEDYLHFRRKRQGNYQFTPQDCLQMFSSIIETHYADKLKFLDK